MSRRAVLALTGLFACLVAPHEAAATYSIIAVDPARGQLGAAGASCVPYEVIRIHGNVSGRGAFVAQANFDDVAFERALELLAGGEQATAVLGAITDSTAFPQSPKMQYGVVDASGGLALWTGPEASNVAGHLEGPPDGAVRFAVLGNLLTSTEVLAQGSEGFDAGGCDLPAQLMDALETAGAEGEGDSRCTPEGRPANSAFLEVSDAEETVIRLSVPDVSPADPIATLRAGFDEWRVDNPCPAPPDTGGSGTEQGTSSEGCAASGRPCSAAAPFAWLFVLAGYRSWKRRPGSVASDAPRA